MNNQSFVDTALDRISKAVQERDALEGSIDFEFVEYSDSENRIMQHHNRLAMTDFSILGKISKQKMEIKGMILAIESH